MRPLIVFLFLINCLHSQVTNRDFRYVDDITHLGFIYKVVRIGTPENHILITTENIKDPYGISPNILDAETQKGQSGVGHIISPVIDSIFFNWEAANSVCPTSWRIPRITEWDSILGPLSIEQKVFLFGSLPGLILSEHQSEGDSIYKVLDIKQNGFWWSSDLSSESEAYVIEVDNRRNVFKRRTKIWNGASVRCIYREIEQ